MAGKFELFEFGDLDNIRAQARHAGVLRTVRAHPLAFKHLMETPWSWTYWRACGRPVACAGILYTGDAWAFLGEDMKDDMVPFLRATRNVLEAYSGAVGPVKSQIDTGHPEAVRWARLLGFRQAAGENWKFS